jgi:serine/threonine protein kinase
MRRRTLHNAGDIIADRYEVVSFVAEGGMQEVYLAEDHHLQRKVALKTPKNSSADRRFQRSAIASARVNHPNVAKTLDYLKFGESQYLIEEYIDGSDINRGILEVYDAVDPALVAKILHHLAKGLAASHRVGIIHRDLKPNNIMYTGGINVDDIKITDFGIAKMAGEEIAVAVEKGVETASSRTAFGALPYMSPEMIKGPRYADKPSDVWAVGAVAYELLAGEPPFGVGYIAANKIVNNETPGDPVRPFVRSQFYSLARELASIIMGCLEPDSAQRPTAEMLAYQCDNLCYSIAERQVGKVSYIHEGKTYGTILSSEGRPIFFHKQSVYGSMPSVDERVVFSSFPGHPNPRAHPVARLKDGR